MKFRVSWLALSFWALASYICGQSAEFYPLELVKPGQKGFGKTVFEGTKIETFDVEIIGVLQNVGPKQNLILARLSGDRISKTGVFAGMSGSPVYLDDRMVGAVAYAFPFAKEAIAGITPIYEIIDIFKEKPEARMGVARRHPRKMYRVAQWSAPEALREFPVDASLYDVTAYGNLRPIRTPLNLAGFSPEAIRAFAGQFEALGLVPVRGMGTGRVEGYDNVPLQAGSSISVQLVRGDMDVSASGTLTHVSGNKVYAFGHPLLRIGYTDMPLNKAAVLTVISSLMSSEKISATMEFVGAIRQDRATGIMGVTGEQPKLIPVRLRLFTSRKEIKEFNYEVVTDNLLTPLLMTFTVHNSIISSERAIGGQTLQVKCKIQVKGHPEVSFENSVSALVSTPVIAALAAASPVNFLLNSGFEDLVMERVDLEISAVEQTREAILDKVWQDKLEARPGEEVNVTVFLRRPNGETVAEKYPVKIPDEVVPGLLNILVGDGISLDKFDESEDPGEFVPENLPQLIRAINNLKKNDRLYILLYREQPGAVIGGEGLPSLPPSLLALYNSQKTAGDVKAIKKVLYAEYELPPTDSVLSGQKVIKVNVKN